LEDTKLTDHVAMLEFFQAFANFLKDEKLVLIIDEFDGIPPEALRGFLLAGASEGYYVVFDHRAEPEPRVETETIEGLTLR